MDHRKMYRSIARKHGVTVGEVKAEMKNAIDAAYENPQKPENIAAFQKAIKKEEDIPTVEEFLRYIAETKS